MATRISVEERMAAIRSKVENFDKEWQAKIEAQREEMIKENDEWIKKMNERYA